MKKLSLKFLSTLLGIAMISTLTLTGCGSKQASNSGNTTQDPKLIKATITYWSHDNADFVKANEKLIADFQKEYPNIKVNYQNFPYDIFMTKLKTAYAAGNESDVQQIFGSWASSYAKKGLLSEVPQDMISDIKANYYPAPVEGYTINGKLYGVPREVNIENGGVLYYPDQLKAVGYDKFPATYEELVDAAKKLTKYDSNGNITHIGFDFNSWDNQPYTLLSFILQQGASYWNKDKIHVNFSTPEGEKAMQALADLLVKDKVTDIKHTNNYNIDTYNTFFKGSSSMCYRGPWTIAAGKNEFKLDNFDYGAMPSFTGTSQAFASEPGWGEVVSSRSKNKEAAWLFVKFITNAGNSKYWNTTSYTVPAIKANAESEEFLKSQPMFKPTIDVLKYAQAIGPIGDMDEFKTIINNHFQKIADGKEDAKTALSSMDTEINKMIDRVNAQ